MKIEMPAGATPLEKKMNDLIDAQERMISGLEKRIAMQDELIMAHEARAKTNEKIEASYQTQIAIMQQIIDKLKLGPHGRGILRGLFQ